MPRRAEQRRNHRRYDRRVEPVLRRHAGEHGEGDALRQHHDRAHQSGAEIGAQGGAAYQPAPAQERENTVDLHGVAEARGS